ncbi:MAG: GreA/GreB family elongation factor [Phycisphaerae bacterium]|nr:GreA/GreB family elongation factor [Phycisphaerae bacterium]
MQYETLQTLAKGKAWSELEREWLAAIEGPGADPARLLPVIDLVVEAKQGDLAETLAWAWLSVMKETHTPAEALRLGRGLLLRLPDGEELRDEILALYRETHRDRPDLESWIERSGLKSGKSVRRALGYLTTALRLSAGTYVTHRTEDEAAEVIEFNAEEDLVTIRTAWRGRTFEIAKLVEDYEIADENDFRVLSQLCPDRLAQLVEEDPVALAIGILRCRGNRIDRDELKLVLVPRYLPAAKWSGWWGKIRDGVKRSPHLRTEGRSPTFLIYDEVGQSREAGVWMAFCEASTPREWLDLLEGYLRDTKRQKEQPDLAFLDRVQSALAEHVEQFIRRKEPANAFATALVVERIAADRRTASTDAHGAALKKLKEAEDPVAVVASVNDARLWSLAIRCVEQVFPGAWVELFAELILHAPAGQCDILAKKVEKAGRGDLLPSIVQRATADPGQFTDAMMWVWKGPTVKTDLSIPPRLEMLNVLLGLVGPVRMSKGKAVGQSANEMRARVRVGLAAKRYGTFKACLDDLDVPMAQTIRRQLERAEGLGPRVQEDMLNILRARFPELYVKAKVEMWKDESVLYFSAAGLQAKEAELSEIVNVKMRENAKAIGEAAAHGDLSENAEYKFALEERDLLRARVARLNGEVSMAKVLELHNISDDRVRIGHRVTLRPTNGEGPVVMTIMGINDTDLNRKVYSYQTPLAQQILGKRVGDVATLALDGQEAEYRIERIESAIA